MCHMLGISAETTTRGDIVIWGPIQAMGGGWYWYCFVKKWNTYVHCRLLQQVPYCEKADSMAANDPVKVANIIFAEFGLPKKFISDGDWNFTPNILRQFCRQKNIKQTITSSYHHQSNGQVEAYIKFTKHAFQKCLDTIIDVNLALFQIRSTPIGADWPVLLCCYSTDQ